MTRLASHTLFITESDKAKLLDLLDYIRHINPQDLRYVERLEQEIDHAEVVAAVDIPPDIITMGSRIRIRDLKSGDVIVYTLVFPHDADPAKGRISVLAPIGTALLGYRVGDVIEWEVPAGTRRLKVESVLYQPEAQNRAMLLAA